VLRRNTGGAIMSRIGKLPVVIQAGTSVTETPDNIVTVKGPLG